MRDKASQTSAATCCGVRIVWIRLLVGASLIGTSIVLACREGASDLGIFLGVVGLLALLRIRVIKRRRAALRSGSE